MWTHLNVAHLSSFEHPGYPYTAWFIGSTDGVSLSAGLSVIFALPFGDASGAEQLQVLLLAPDANLREQLHSTYFFQAE